MIPQRLYRGLLTGKADQKCTQTVEMLINQFYQDALYAVTDGQNKPLCLYMEFNHGLKMLNWSRLLIDPGMQFPTRGE